MAKLPTTWTKLDLSGFEINQDQVPAKGINRQMVDMACDVLQANKIAIRNRTVQQALKEIYGVGGSATDVCNLLKEWRKENTDALKEGKNDKDLVTAILDSVDDGLLADEEIPEEFLTISKQIAQATYRLAYQTADTNISGERLRQLSIENDTLRQQLKEFPQIQMELDFYQKQYERQQSELKSVYIQLNKQQLADSEEFSQRLDSLMSERNNLVEQLVIATERLNSLTETELSLAKLSGSLSAREQEVSQLQSQIQSLQQSQGEKEVIEQQLAEVKQQLATAHETITQLQSQSRQSAGLEVDVDVDQLVADNQELNHLVQVLNDQISHYQQLIDSDSVSVIDSDSVINSVSEEDDFTEMESKGSKGKKEKQTA